MAVSLSNGDIIATGRVQGSKVKVQNLVDFEVGQTTLAALLAEMLAAKLSDSTADYDATAAYVVGSFVKHDCVLYVCKTAIATGGEAWNPAHWTAMPDAAALFSSANSALAGVISGSVTPVLTQGEKIATVGGKDLYAPTGGGGGGDDEKMQTVFDELARMDAFTSTSTESDAFDVAITKLSELLGEDVSELAA